MSSPAPFFSVIVPTYDRAKFLKIALDSVLSQSYSDFELIVIDDGSTDGTKILIKECNDPRIVYFYQDNHGVAHARNRGLEKATGEWVAFLDSDDQWIRDKLKKTAEYIKEFPSVKIFHTEEKWYRNGKVLNQKKKHKKPTGFIYRDALPICCIGMSTSVVHRSVFDKIGLFDESLTACEDYDFWLRAAHEFEVKLIPEVLTIKDGGRPDQLSAQPGLDRFRIKALHKMLSSGKLNQEEAQLTQKYLQEKAVVYIEGAKKRGKFEEAENYQWALK